MSTFEDVGQCIDRFKSTISFDKKMDDYNNH